MGISSPRCHPAALCFALLSKTLFKGVSYAQASARTLCHHQSSLTPQISVPATQSKHPIVHQNQPHCAQSTLPFSFRGKPFTSSGAAGCVTVSEDAAAGTSSAPNSGIDPSICVRKGTTGMSACSFGCSVSVLAPLIFGFRNEGSTDLDVDCRCLSSPFACASVPLAVNVAELGDASSVLLSALIVLLDAPAVSVLLVLSAGLNPKAPLCARLGNDAKSPLLLPVPRCCC